MSITNFNFQNQPSYDLNSGLIKEVINLYGIQVKFLVTEKINKDDLIFGDYSHLKTNSDKAFEIYGLPEESEGWESMGINFSEFGMVNMDSIQLFVHKDSLGFMDFSETSKGFDSIIGNLVVLPNSRIMEITDFDFEVPGVNNLYTEANQKSCFKLVLKTYQNKIIQELGQGEITAPDSTEDYTTLDNYFSELLGDKDEVDTQMGVVDSVETVVKDSTSETDTKVQKPKISYEEDSIFGNF